MVPATWSSLETFSALLNDRSKDISLPGSLCVDFDVRVCPVEAASIPPRHVLQEGEETEQVQDDDTAAPDQNVAVKRPSPARHTYEIVPEAPLCKPLAKKEESRVKTE